MYFYGCAESSFLRFTHTLVGVVVFLFFVLCFVFLLALCVCALFVFPCVLAHPARAFGLCSIFFWLGLARLARALPRPLSGSGLFPLGARR